MPTDWNAIAAYLEQQRLLLVSAESCTAGEVAALMARMDASARWLQCSFVIDHPGAENLVLGVAETTIRRFGATSEQVALETAIAALDQSSANFAIANVGHAASGRVCFAWAMLAAGWVRSSTETRLFRGSADEVRRLAADYAVEQLPARHQELTRREQDELRRRFA
ncbi:MAG: Nicotinamide-nucleotide amidohydrolase PncC [Herbaspirillum frisingense]|uniref:Nicotinamide-nucleotide amidohydrolase PncC n=1 Tax=Herbaspirillum frisingense TaxID=92645 RepID=A0A7V8JV62_9BURK|nr:MAG: Nicotinamide-nucleotide amidohydrolase PncC [Herbaspirillum frisingense]